MWAIYLIVRNNLSRRGLLFSLPSVLFFSDLLSDKMKKTTETGPWPTFAGNSSNTRAVDSSVGPTRRVSKSWSTEVNNFSGKRADDPVMYPSPIIAEGTLFLDGYAIDIGDGSTRWSTNWDATPSHHDGSLITREDSHIIARNAQNGDIVYEREITTRPLHTVVNENTVYTAPSDGDNALITARNAFTGDIRWQATTVKQGESSEDYVYRTSIPLAVSDKAVAIAGQRQYSDSVLWRSYVGVIDVDTGEPRWYRDSRASIAPVIYDNIVFLCNNKNNPTISAYEVSSGIEWWHNELDIQGNFHNIKSIAVTNNHLVASIDGDNPGKVISLSTSDGKLNWSTEINQAPTPPIIIDEQVIVGTGDGEILSLSINNGDILWSEEDQDINPSSLVAGHNRLYLSGTNGEISTFMDVDNTPPEPEINHEPNVPIIGETVRFDARNSTDEHEIESYEWAFGTGNSFDDEGVIIDRSFEKAGDIVVRLRVTDEFSESAESSKTISIAQPHEPPSPEFTHAPADPVVEDTVEFDATGSVAHDGSIVSYEWDFGNGFVDGSAVTEHTFEESGEHTVTLRVRDDEGFEATEQQLVEIGRRRLNIALTGSSINTQTGKVETTTLSVTNFLTSEELTIQLLLETPSGVEVRGVRGADEGSNQYTAVATLEPSEHKNLRIEIVVNNPGKHEITAIADYYFEPNQDDTGRHTGTITIDAEPTDDESNQGSDEESTDFGGNTNGHDENTNDDSFGPGFGITEAVAGFTGTSYLVKRHLSSKAENDPQSNKEQTEESDY